MALHTNDKATRPAGNYTVALAVLTTVFFMWGFATVLNDILVPRLKAVFSLNYAQSLLVQFVFYLAYLLMAIPAAKVLERMGYKASVMFGYCPPHAMSTYCSTRCGARRRRPRCRMSGLPEGTWRLVSRRISPTMHHKQSLDLSSRSGRAVAAAYRKHFPPGSTGFRESNEMSRLPAG
jgi:hypothetical protein